MSHMSKWRAEVRAHGKVAFVIESAMLADLSRFLWADVDALTHTSRLQPQPLSTTVNPVAKPWLHSRLDQSWILLELEQTTKVIRNTPVLTKLTLTFLGGQIRT
mgnify:FL=1